jgi:regulator of replication initiation timing
MQSELESLRSENDVLKRERELMEFENERLRKALDKAHAEREFHMVKKGELKTLLDSAGALLVNGVRKYHDGGAELTAAEPLKLEGAST